MHNQYVLYQQYGIVGVQIYISKLVSINGQTSIWLHIALIRTCVSGSAQTLCGLILFPECTCLALTLLQAAILSLSPRRVYRY